MKSRIIYAKGGHRERSNGTGGSSSVMGGGARGGFGYPMEKDHRCRLCSVVGHWEQYCSKRKGKGNDCFKCGGKDHRARECRATEEEIAKANYAEEDDEQGW